MEFVRSYTYKIIPILIIGILLLCAMKVSACSEQTLEPSPEKTFNNLILIIKKPQTTMSPVPIAQGLFIAEDKVITVLDYDDVISGKYGPGSLGILGVETEMRIHSADSHTGASILIVTDTENEPCKTGDACKLKPGQNVSILGWSSPGISQRILQSTVVDIPDKSSAFFTLKISDNDAVRDWTPGPGAVVTDMEGTVLGLVQTSCSRSSPDISSDELSVTAIPITYIMQWMSQGVDTIGQTP